MDVDSVDLSQSRKVAKAAKKRSMRGEVLCVLYGFARDPKRLRMKGDGNYG